MNSGAVFIMGFCNVVFLNKIYNLLKHKKNTFILFLHHFPQSGTHKVYPLLIVNSPLLFMKNSKIAPKNNRKILEEESLAILKPELIEYWDEKKNEKDPFKIRPTYGASTYVLIIK